MEIQRTMNLETLALGIMIFVGVTLFYIIIAIHDIPYEMAKKRNHPHLDAIHVAGWISMFTLHAIWPFLWIWATLYRDDQGYGFSSGGDNVGELTKKLSAIEERLAKLEKPEKAKD